MAMQAICHTKYQLSNYYFGRSFWVLTSNATAVASLADPPTQLHFYILSCQIGAFVSQFLSQERYLEID
jgi:hypothetical protein